MYDAIKRLQRRGWQVMSGESDGPLATWWFIAPNGIEVGRINEKAFQQLFSEKYFSRRVFIH